MTYAEKLRHPKWQKKRLEILQRDGFKCVKCGDADSALHVHHKVYEYGCYPWDYDNRLLVTLCYSCHELEEMWKGEFKGLINDLMLRGFFYEEIDDKLRQQYPY